MKCNICGGIRFDQALGVRDLARCRNCGLIFFRKQPSPGQIKKFYNTEIFSPAEYYKKMQKADKKNFSIVMGHVEKIKPAGKLLDVGCSTGNLMEFARSRGWSCYGIELNKKAVEECRRRKLNVKSEVLGRRTFSNSYFDWINLGDVIEHVKNPKELLRICNSKLKKDGVLTLSTPDISKWLARKFQIKPGEHIFYFDKKTIRMILEMSGFRISKISNYTPYRNISALAHSSTFNQTSKKAIFSSLGKMGDIVIRMPLNDELYVVAIKN